MNSGASAVSTSCPAPPIRTSRSFVMVRPVLALNACWMSTSRWYVCSASRPLSSSVSTPASIRVRA
jgi:hypothetical protein